MCHCLHDVVEKNTTTTLLFINITKTVRAKIVIVRTAIVIIVIAHSLSPLRKYLHMQIWHTVIMMRISQRVIILVAIVVNVNILFSKMFIIVKELIKIQ